MTRFVFVMATLIARLSIQRLVCIEPPVLRRVWRQGLRKTQASTCVARSSCQGEDSSLGDTNKCTKKFSPVKLVGKGCSAILSLSSSSGRRCCPVSCAGVFRENRRWNGV